MQQIDKNNYTIVINNNELFTLAKGYDEKYGCVDKKRILKQRNSTLRLP